MNNTDVNKCIGEYSKSVNAGIDTGGTFGFDDEPDGDSTWLGEVMKFSRIQGVDGCGTIVAVKNGVTPNRVGERVLIRSMHQRETNEDGLGSITYG